MWLLNYNRTLLCLEVSQSCFGQRDILHQKASVFHWHVWGVQDVNLWRKNDSKAWKITVYLYVQYFSSGCFGSKSDLVIYTRPVSEERPHLKISKCLSFLYYGNKTRLFIFQDNTLKRSSITLVILCFASGLNTFRAKMVFHSMSGIFEFISMCSFSPWGTVAVHKAPGQRGISAEIPGISCCLHGSRCFHWKTSEKGKNK